MVPAKYFMSKISDYLERKYRDTKDVNRSKFDVRWNKEHTSFYVYNRNGQTVSALLNISDVRPSYYRHRMMCVPCST